MVAIQSHLEAKRLVDKYRERLKDGQDPVKFAVGIANQRMLHALEMSKEDLPEDRVIYWQAQASFWMEVKQSIESV